MSDWAKVIIFYVVYMLIMYWVYKHGGMNYENM